MATQNYRVRRATIDDIEVLKALWKSLELPVEDLERRLTEFQVAEDANGHVVGAFGVKVQARNACIHSEAFEDFAIAEEVRPLFWERVEVLAANHGIARLWTQEQAPFWSRNGFQPVTQETLQKLPAEWNSSRQHWLTSRLKDEEVFASLDKEVALLMASERRRTAQTIETTKTLKMVLTAIGILVACAIFGAAIYVYFVRASLGAR